MAKTLPPPTDPEMAKVLVEDGDFAVHRQMVPAIRKHLEKSRQLLDGWLIVQADFLVKQVDISAVRTQYNRVEPASKQLAIELTLDRWIARGAKVATFKTLIKIIGEHDQRVVEELQENRTQIHAIESEEPDRCAPEQRRVQILSSKWWPDHKELIPSFIERCDVDGHLIIDNLRHKLEISECGVAAIVSKKQVIVGMGGIGKTTTAKWYANAKEDEYDHIFWMDSEGQSLNNSITRLGTKLELERDPAAKLHEYMAAIYEKLRPARCLFIFDNAERFAGENGLRQLLSAHEHHHSIITSRNHDWGNSNEFQIPVYELDMFSEAETINLLSSALKKVGKSATEEEMLDSGKEMGFLPLALQCAIATIGKSRHYTVVSYLKRIRTDLKVLMDKKILNEYERTITATLNLSIQQIADDEEIEEECREWCKAVLYIAAYCEPSDIPEALFLHLIKEHADDFVIGEAVDQLIAYSLLSAEENDEEERETADGGVIPTDGLGRFLGMHRLLQQVVRNRATQDSEYAVPMLKMALEILQVLLDVPGFAGHAHRLWQQASTQFDEIVKSCRDFLISLCDRFYVIEFQQTVQITLDNLTRVYSGWDIPVVQMELAYMDALLIEESEEYWDKARRRGDTLQETIERSINGSGIPFGRELLLHVRICNLGIQYNAIDETYGNMTSTRIRDLATSYEQVLEEISETGYDGEITGVKMRVCWVHGQTRLPFKTGVILSYIVCLCWSDETNKAIEVTKVEVGKFDESGINLFAGIERYITWKRGSVKALSPIFPILYDFAKSRLQSQSLADATDLKPSLRERVADICVQHAKWLWESGQFDGWLKVLAILTEIAFDDGLIFIVRSFNYVTFNTLVKATDLAPFQPEDLIPLMNNLWRKFVEAIERGKLQVEQYLEELLRLNLTYTFALMQIGRFEDVVELDAMVLSMMNKCSIHWNLLLEIAEIIQDKLIPACVANFDSELDVLQSKLDLTLCIIQLTTPDDNEMRRMNNYTAEALISLYDSACCMHIHLEQPEEAVAVWELCVRMLSAVHYVNTSAVGRKALTLLERKLGAEETLQLFVDELANYERVRMQDSGHYYLDDDPQEDLQYITRLVRHRHYTLVVDFINKLKHEEEGSSSGHDTTDELKALVPELMHVSQDQDEKRVEFILSKLKGLLPSF